MKHVLLIADSNMSLSGVPMVYMSIVRSLHKDFTFDIVILNDNDMYFEKEFLSYGGQIFKFICPKPNKFFQKIKWFCTYAKNVKKYIKNNLNLMKYSVIHSFREGYSYPFFKEAKKAGVKRLILHINSASSAYPRKKSYKDLIYYWYQRLAEKYSTKILFVSEQSLHINNYKNKGMVLYNTYDEKTYNKIILSSTNALVLTQVATISSRKNQLFSLNVIKELKKTYPDVLLKIVGFESEKGYKNKCEEYILKNNLFCNVQFLNGDCNKIELYKETSFLLLPSIAESFGIVLVEAQTCGIHCFANKDIPNDANLGNIDFIELEPKKWADLIISYYEKNGNDRKEPVGLDKFSSINMSNKLKKLYE